MAMTSDELKLNAKLQTKKNTLRKKLKEKGVLKKGKTNTYDNYSYFSEAQYKELFTELFSECGLELSFTEVEYNTFVGTEKQANGRMPKLRFKLSDIDTGYFEESEITGEGIDKGDKGGYKAYTGALKYYLADTFLVATGDDPEKESPNYKMNTKSNVKMISPKQIGLVKSLVTNIPKMLEYYEIEKIEDMTMAQASETITKMMKKKEEEKNNG